MPFTVRGALPTAMHSDADRHDTETNSPTGRGVARAAGDAAAPTPDADQVTAMTDTVIAETSQARKGALTPRAAALVLEVVGDFMASKYYGTRGDRTGRQRT
jgi:hypothetical protein